MPVDTLKPLLATTIPALDASEKQLPGKVSKMLKKVLDGYNELFQNKTDQLNAVSVFLGMYFSYCVLLQAFATTWQA